MHKGCSCAAVAIAAMGAHAEPVVFDNSAGAFDWGYISAAQSWSGNPYLDITKAPGSQEDSWDQETSIVRFVDFMWTSRDPEFYTLRSRDLSNVAVGDSVTLDHWGDWGNPSHHTFRLPKIFQAGDVVGPASAFDDKFIISATYIPVKDEGYEYVDFWNGVQGYVGIQLLLSGRTHYGWIHVTPYCDSALAWAYETMPDTPIAVPIPAPPAWILLAGSPILAYRRRS